jgi:threonine/homoserine/homoserine lactone efflux protein
MHTSVIALSILGALAIGTISPGPSFVVVARTAIARSRRDGLAAALGMGVGAVVFATLALVGLQAALAKVPWLYVGLRLVGGLYLVAISIALWRGATDTIAVPDAGVRRTAAPARSFVVGLSTQLSNPKAAMTYASVFAALLPAQVPVWLFGVLPPLVLLMESGWYMIVALAFSSDRPRAAYLGSKRWIDRIAGAIIGALGLRLVFDTVRPG